MADEPKIDIDTIKSKLPAGVLPDGFDETKLPKSDDFIKIVKQKCEKQTGTNETYNKIEEAGIHLKDCVTGLVDVEVLQQEIEDAQPKGDLDTVFNK